MRAREAPRPGLVEVLAVWAAFGAVALAVLVTYWRLPVAQLYNVDEEGLARGAGRALVFLGYPTALVAVALLAIVADRLRSRPATAAAVLAALLCATVAWPGVVEQSDLDAKPVNAAAGVGVLVAAVLTALALSRGGIGALRPFGAWDVARVALAAVLVAGSLPWIAADLGLYLDGVPGLGALFLSGELRPEPGHPELTAVHLGHHHGMDGTLLALSAIALSRTVGQVSGRTLRGSLALYLSLMLAYGLANAVQDFWLEQLVKRGATSLEIPSLIVPKASLSWAALVVAALLIHFVARRVVRMAAVPPAKGAV